MTHGLNVVLSPYLDLHHLKQLRLLIWVQGFQPSGGGLRRADFIIIRIIQKISLFAVGVTVVIQFAGWHVWDVKMAAFIVIECTCSNQTIPDAEQNLTRSNMRT